MELAVATIKGSFLFGETRSTCMAGHVKNTRCDLDKLGVSFFCVGERESRLPPWASPPGASPLTALGASVSVSSLLSATSTEDIQFDTGSWL